MIWPSGQYEVATDRKPSDRIIETTMTPLRIAWLGPTPTCAPEAAPCSTFIRIESLVTGFRSMPHNAMDSKRSGGGSALTGIVEQKHGGRKAGCAAGRQQEAGHGEGARAESDAALPRR